MGRILLVAIFSSVLSIPSIVMAQSYADEHVEVGVFAEYLRFSPSNPAINFLGFGGRVSFGVHPNLQLEAEMSYDFKRNSLRIASNGGTTIFTATAGLRPLTGLFGPRVQIASRGPFKVFATGKVGFVNFSITGALPSGSTFINSVNNVPDGNTHVAFYPGAGIGGFWGPFGVRMDVGDEIFLNNGARNDLRITFGPQIRF
jgi:hypothetical protein